MSDMITDMVSRLLREHRGRPAEAPALDPGFWAAVEEMGIPLALVPEALGGIGLEAADACAILRVAGAQAIAAPLADTMLASLLLAQAGADFLPGPLAVATAPSGTTGCAPGARFRAVAFGRAATALVVIGDGWIETVPAPFAVEPGANIAGEPRDTLTTIAAASGRWALTVDPAVLRGLRAVLAAAQMAGAAQAALDLTVSYANERVQFGRPIGKFQAIQHHIAVIASEVAAMGAAVDMAAEAIPFAGTDPDGFLMKAAAAKVRCGEAAGRIAGLVHQVHGAIGFTQEYELHMFTRRLWSWRDEHGSEAGWSEMLGERLFARGAAALWQEITRPTGEAA